MVARVRVVLVAMTCVVASATAQPAGPTHEPTEAERARARERFEAAKKLIASEHYAQAYDELAIGYGLTGLPVFLFNMAECARHMSELPRARELYTRYLAAQPDGDMSAMARQRLRELDSSTTPPRKPDPGRPIDQPPGDKPVTPVDPIASSVTTPIRSVPPDTGGTSRGGTLRIAGIATAVAGAGMLGFGVYNAVAAGNRADELEDRCARGCTWGPTEEGLDAAASRHRTRAWIFGAVGTVALIGGGVLAYLGWRRGDGSEPPRVSLALEPGAVFVGWSARY